MSLAGLRDPRCLTVKPRHDLIPSTGDGLWVFEHTSAQRFALWQPQLRLPSQKSEPLRDGRTLDNG